MQAIVQVHETLSRYLVIHNSIFEFSIRKLIPIPFVFEPIDYALHSTQLMSLSAELDLSLNSVDLKPDSPLRDYAEKLKVSIGKLALICMKMSAKVSNRDSYSKSMWEADVRDYNASVTAYSLAGSRLNASMKN